MPSEAVRVRVEVPFNVVVTRRRVDLECLPGTRSEPINIDPERSMLRFGRQI